MWGTQWAGSCQDSITVMQNNTGKAAWVSTAGEGGLKDVSGHLVKLWIRGGGQPRQGLDRFRGGPALPGVT